MISNSKKTRARAKIPDFPNALIIGDIKKYSKGYKFTESSDNEFPGCGVLSDSVQESVGSCDISGKEIFVGDKIIHSIDRDVEYLVQYFDILDVRYFGVKKNGIFMRISNFSMYELI